MSVVTPSEHPDRVLMDPHQVDQILMNLATNGRDAMPQGGRLRLATSRASIDDEYCRHHPYASVGEYVVLSVSDTGLGMDSETRRHAFEPFFSTKDQNRGTGLGLATVYGIVKQNGGFIELRSQLGEGTSVEVYLPRTEATIRPPKAAPTRETSGLETVLVVEDEPMVRTLVRRILTRKGYTVLIAKDPTEALKVAEAHRGPIHLLLTDVVMPKLNGRALFEQLRPAYPDMKVLFMSGYSENIIAHHGVVERDIEFLSKPFSADALERKVREVLERETGEPGARS